MSRTNRIKVLVGLLVLALAATTTVVVVILRQNADQPVADHPFVVDLGPTTPRAASVVVGGRAFPLTTPAAGPRSTQVALTGGAGGVAFVSSADGAVLATAPVWSIPGLSVGDVPATCESTAFDQLLLTPGLSNPNPLAIDILWGLAHRGPASDDLHQLGSLICARLAQPHSLATPTDAEVRTYGHLVVDIQAEITDTAAPLPAPGDSLGGIGAVTDPRPGGSPASAGPASATPSAFTHTVTSDHPRTAPAALVGTRVPATASSPCGDGKTPVMAAGAPAPSLGLCAGGADLAITNNSAAWAFLYSQHPQNGDDLLAVVPGRSAEVPSLEKIIGAVVHDIVANDYRTGCALLSWLDVCHPSPKPPTSEVSKLLDLVRPGEAETRTADGYYSIAWGNQNGDRTAFPAGRTQKDIDDTEARSRVLTFFSDGILPFIAVILDHQISPELDADQLPAILPTLDRLAELSTESSAATANSSIQGHIETLSTFALKLASDPQLLGDAISAFAPDASGTLKDVIRALPSYLLEADVPVAGWAILLVRLVDEGSAAANAFISVADMFTAETKPSYASWPGTLSASDAATLPAAQLQYEGQATCPPPPAGVVVPDAPAGLQCLWNVTADLDGNGRDDHLILWSTPQLRGAVALLDDGSAHPLANAAIGDTSTPDNAPWEASGGDAATPLRIYTAGATPRQQVLIGTTLGAHGWDGDLVGLAPDGRLLLATQDSGRLADLQTLDDLGCATVAGRRTFVITSRGNTEATAPTDGPFGISSDFYSLTDGVVFSQIGYAGSVVGARPTSDDLDNDCGTTVPNRSLGPPATSPQDALKSLLEAATLRDPNAASAYVGGAGADFDNGLLVPDVYAYLTATPGVDPRHWLPDPISCDPDPNFPTRQNCSIEPADGSVPLHAELGRNDHYWTVAALGAG